MAKAVYDSGLKKTVDGVLSGNGFEIEGRTYLKLAGYDYTCTTYQVMGVDLESNVLKLFPALTPCVELNITIHLQR